MTNKKTVILKNKKEEDSPLKKIINLEEFKILPKVGDLVKGEIVDISPNAVRIDINGIAIGIIRGYELYDESGEYSTLKIGDKVSATVLELENEQGEVELSFRYAGHEKAWEKLNEIMEKGEIIPVKVIDANKGGLMVKVNRIMGFLPVSQLSPEKYPRVEGGAKNKILEKLKKLINKKINVKVIDISKEEKKLIVSEKAIIEKKEKEALSKYKVGDIIEGEISGLVDFGAFLRFNNNMEGLIHISELAWQRIDHPQDVVKVGQKVKAKIISLDNLKVSFSLKQLKEDPWKEASQKYKIGQIIKGRVLKMNPFGLFVELDEKIHGLCHISEIPLEIKKGLGKKIESNNVLEFKILSIEPEDHRLGLSIKALKEKENNTQEHKNI